MSYINILTLKTGNKYTADYVNKLYNSLSRNTTVDFNFYCYTEDSNGLDSNINVIPLTLRDDVVKQWYKIDFHNMPQFYDQKCLILDIDTLITGNIDHILNKEIERNQLGGYWIWWNNIRSINGGFQMFWGGDTIPFHNKFYDDVNYWQSYFIEHGMAEPPINGEQNFITHSCEEFSIEIISMEKGEFTKYSDRSLERIKRLWNLRVDVDSPSIGPFMDDNGNLNSKIKLVHFANADNYIHENTEKSFVQDLWI